MPRYPCVDRWGSVQSSPTSFVAPLVRTFFITVMDKKKSATHFTEVHFHAPVGQYIDYIEHQTVTFDKDMNMHIAHLANNEEKSAVPPSCVTPDFFCISARFTEDNIRERLAAELAQAVSKIDYCRALYRLQHIGCININQYASDAKRAIVFNDFQNKFTLSASDFCKARASI